MKHKKIFFAVLIAACICFVSITSVTIAKPVPRSPIVKRWEGTREELVTHLIEIGFIDWYRYYLHEG